MKQTKKGDSMPLSLEAQVRKLKRLQKRLDYTRIKVALLQKARNEIIEKVWEMTEPIKEGNQKWTNQTQQV